MTDRPRPRIALLLMLLLLAGCGGAGPTPAATQAPPATAVPAATTALPAPPTATDTPQPAATTAPEPTAAAAQPEAALAISGPLTITILYDNTTLDPRLRAEWGFAALISHGGGELLFDTGGDGPTLLGNMAQLGVDPAAISLLVLSHEHDDHTGGLQALGDLGLTPAVYLSPSSSNALKTAIAARTAAVEVEPGQAIADGIYTTGEIRSGPVPEQALVILTEDGLVIVTGCAHPGVVTIVERAKELFAGPVRLLLGGFHLMGMSETEVGAILQELRQLGVEQVTPTHCTGEKAISLFAAEYGPDYIPGGVGQVIVVAPGQPAYSARPAEPVPATGFSLSGVGLSTPESVLYDPQADLYLVSNINGGPGTQDDNGFITRVSPAGQVVELTWIDGAAEGVTLHAPKGMALSGAALYVADIDTLRSFDRQTGAPLGEVAVAGASFLNDVAASEDGTIYVTDSGSGTIYRLDLDGTVAQAAVLAGANGIAVQGPALLIAGAPDKVTRMGPDSSLPPEVTLPAGGLDGLVALDDGAFLVSSWGGSAIYRVAPDGQVSTLFEGLPAPADIGFDTLRGLLLIPLFQDDAIEVKPLPQD